MHIRWQQIVIGAGMVLLMTFLFLRTNVIDSDAHNHFSNDLRHLKELDATLDKNILESRYGLSNSYDLLITESNQLKQLQTDLKDVPAFVDHDGQEKLKELFDKYTELQEQKELLVERFKSRNAIINNSLRYFPITTANLIKNVSTTGSGQKEAEQQLNYLLRDTLIYYLLSGKELESKITDQIALLQELQKNNSAAVNKSDLDISISHAQTILRLKPEVDNLVKEIVSLPTSNQIEEIIKLYDSFYNQALSRANTYRLFLYIFSVLMLAYIGYIIVKLKQATLALNAVNENLEHRVEERTAELVRSNEAMQLEVAERKRAEVEVSEAKLFLRKVIDNVPNLIFVKNSEGQFTLVNQAFAEIYDATVENIIGKTNAELGNEAEYVARVRIDDLQVLENGQERIIPEEKFTDAKGNLHWFQTVKRPLISTDGKARSLLGVATDLTERKLLEDQLQRGQKLESIGQLAAGIAHEINTPTQYVGDNIWFLKESFQDFNGILKKNDELLESCRSNTVTPELVAEMEKVIERADLEYLESEVPKAFDQALDGVERNRKIVQSMKDFAHPGSTDKKATDLNKAIESTITVASNEWKYVADVVTDYDQDLPPVYCFAGEFNQVILNMIINAAHAITDTVGDGSNGRGTITISTKCKDEWAEVRISDTGTGIPEEIRQKIFDPFFTTKEVGKGSGQGLAISHAVITEKHKGEILIESEMGKGTTFIINLPVNKISEQLN